MKGLTLIELMISVALLTIFLSVGIPGVSYLIDRFQAKTTVSTLKNIFIKSRSSALEEEITVTTCPIINNICSFTWRGNITAFVDSNNNRAIDSTERIIFSTQLNTNSGYWQKKRVNSPFVNFNPRGHAFSSATTFLYCPYSSHTTHAKQLVISFQGRIRVNNYLSDNGTPHTNVAPLACIHN